MTCKDCGATVTSSDRFCPACGTPNAQTKFQPKFAPALRIVEPRIVIEPVPAGAPSCPRCHRLIERPEEYCRGCGMGLGAAWDRFDRVTVLNEWKSQGRTETYRSPVLFARALEPVLHVGVVVAAAMGGANLWLYARSEGVLRSGPPDTEVLRALDIATLAAVVLFALGFALLVLWLRRSYRNLSALAVGDLRFSPAWAVWGWLIPGINLFRPKQIVDDVWKGSHPMAPPFSPTWRVTPVPAWSMSWWASLLLAGVLGATSHLYSVSAAAGDATALEIAQVLAGITGLLLACSSLCLQLIVRRSTERQETRALFILDPDEAGPDGALASAGGATVASLSGESGIADAPSLVHVNAATGTESVYGRY